MCMVLSCAMPQAWAADDPNAEAGGIDLTDEYFPDEIFRLHIWTKIDKNMDGVLSNAERNAVIGLDLNNIFISDLTGVEYFPNLSTINCSGNLLKKLDLSANSKLTIVNCSNNQLTELYLPPTTVNDIGLKIGIQTLNCSNNELTELNVSGLTNMLTLNCSNNMLDALDVYNNTALRTLDCSKNLLLGLDVADNTRLLTLNCSENTLRLLNVRENGALTTLNCSLNRLLTLNLEGNADLVTLDCHGNELMELDLTANRNLSTVDCSFNELEAIDLSRSTSLLTLDCSSNKLSGLDVAPANRLTSLICSGNPLGSVSLESNTRLTKVECSNCQLKEIDVSTLASLTSLDCSGNSLSDINLIFNKNLQTLNVSNNRLKVLDLTLNKSLTELNCSYNQLTSLDLISQNSTVALTCYGNRYEIILDGNKAFDLSTLPGTFNVELASSWLNATIDGTVITVDDIEQDVTYLYKPGGKSLSATFALYIDLNSVIFDPNGGTTSLLGKPLDDSGVFGELPTAEREGYTFVGWYTLRTGGELVTAETSTTEVTARRLYAHWEPNKFTVTLDPGEGTCPEESVTVEYDSLWGRLPAATRVGYTFDGWYTEDGVKLGKNDKVKISEDCTVIAHWIPKTYTFTFDPNGGECSVKEKTVTYDAPCGEMPVPTMTGYHFTSWTDAAGNVYDENTIVKITETTPLKANYAPNQYEVTLDCAGGTCESESVFVTYNEPYGELPEPSRDGYTFTGWFRADGSEFDPTETVTITEGITVTATWIANLYQITFDTCGGECDEKSRIVTYDEPFGELPKATRAGFFFLGWYTAPTGGERVREDTIVKYTSNDSIYAQWSDSEIPIIEGIFPDDNLRAAVVELLDTNSNGSISASEVQAAKRIDVSGRRIGSLNGLEFFTDTTALICSGNELTEIDISVFEHLTTLDCSDNRLESIDLSLNPTLEAVNVSKNPLSGLDVSRNPALKTLNCASTGLSLLELDANLLLETLDCSNCNFKELKLQRNPVLSTLRCSGNPLVSFTAPKSIVILDCSSCQLTKLELSGATVLRVLDCSDNALETLNVSKNTKLDTLDCTDNALTSLDLTNCPGVANLYTARNYYVISADPAKGTFDTAMLPAGFDAARVLRLDNAVAEGSVWRVTDPAQNVVYEYSLGEGRGTAEFSLIMLEHRLALDAAAGECEAEYIIVYDGYRLGVCGALPTPTRTGYVFDGWYTSAEGGSRVTDDTAYSSLSTDTLYAHWTAEKYPVYFVGGEGSVVSKDMMTVSYDSKYGILPIASKPGYDFLGWFTAEEGGEKITGDSIVAFTVEQTLYAHWKEATFKVFFDVNSGDSVSDDMIEVVYLSAYGELPTAERVGYNFEGWFTAREGGMLVTSETIYESTEDDILYAHWVPKIYTVTFDSNGGLCLVRTMSVTYDTEWVGMPEPAKSNYNFVGWFTAKEGGEQVQNGDKVKITENSTLYAHWDAMKYTVTFDAMSGECDVGSKIVAYAETYGELPEPTRFGYNFGGWWDTSACNVNQILPETVVKLKADQTLYAKWEPYEFTVTFDPTGGTCDVETMTVYYGRAYAQKMPEPTRYGYGFSGWYTERVNGTKITASTKCLLTEDQTLYAQWTAKKQPVSFDANGGSCSVVMREFTFDQPYAAFPKPVRAGYVFVGWFTEAVGGEMLTEEQIVKSIEPQTFHAHWKGMEGVLTFDPNGGTCPVESVPFSYDQQIVTLPEPEYPGHNFLGWYNAAGEQFYIGEQVYLMNTFNIEAGNETQNIDFTLTAKWETAMLELTFDPNGGSCDVVRRMVRFGDKLGELPVPVKEGSSFVGWFTAKRGGEPVADGDEVAFLGDTIVYAVWCSDSNTLTVPSDKLADGGAVWIDGVEYIAEPGGTVYLEEGTKPKTAIIVTENDTAEGDPHGRYPTALEVWFIERGESGEFTARHIPELDNALQYMGTSIRTAGTKGIRMITAISANLKKTLTSTGIEGYTLKEYGTLVGWADEIGSGDAVLGRSYIKAAYAYRKGVADAVYMTSGGLNYYTNVLVGFTDEQCAYDLVMRPYMILENASGETVTVYGGEIVRSIGYIALQNRNSFTPGTADYEYVWHIIHIVYGTEYDSEYKPK